MKKTLFELLFILLGSFLFALSINVFIIPQELGEGGVTGITIILYYLYSFSPWVVSLAFNSILVIVSIKLLSKKTAIYTVISTLLLSLFLHLTEGFSVSMQDTISAAVAGGVLTGIGIGLILKVGGTTAGSTLLALITNKYLGWSISYGMLFFDVVVVSFSTFIVGIEHTIYTMVMLYVGTKVLDFILVGVNNKKAVTIVTTNPKDIADNVNHSISRGVTVLSGYGYYSKESKDVLYIVVKKSEITEIKKIIYAADKEAFVTVHDVKDVFGKGFIELSKR